MDPSGSTLVIGFDDGVLRVAQVCNLKKGSQIKRSQEEQKIIIRIIQTIKPHNKPLTCFEINPDQTLLVSGSEDKTIFMFCIRYVHEVFTLVPIGFIPVPSRVTCLTWNPKEVDVIYVGGFHGELLEVTIPTEPQDYTEISFLLNIEPRRKTFTTCKSQIRRDIKIREIEAKKLKKLLRKKEELAKIKASNPGLEIDEEQFLREYSSRKEGMEILSRFFHRGIRE